MKIYQHYKIDYKFILTLPWVPVLALNHSLTAQPTDLPITVKEWRSDSLVFKKGLLKSVNPLWHKWHVKQACRVRTIKFPLGKMFFHIGHKSIWHIYVHTATQDCLLMLSFRDFHEHHPRHRDAKLLCTRCSCYANRDPSSKTVLKSRVIYHTTTIPCSNANLGWTPECLDAEKRASSWSLNLAFPKQILDVSHWAMRQIASKADGNCTVHGTSYLWADS